MGMAPNIAPHGGGGGGGGSGTTWEWLLTLHPMGGGGGTTDYYHNREPTKLTAWSRCLWSAWPGGVCRGNKVGLMTQGVCTQYT